MRDIYAYFKNSQGYILDSRHTICTFPNNKQETLYKCISNIKKEYNLKGAIMGFNQPLRNTIYALFPDVKIIISPLSVKNMIGNCLDNNIYMWELEEEIAIGLEENFTLDKKELVYNIIYGSQTKAEAIESYKEWQSYIPLGIKAYHHIIRKIDFYYDEVFNYFDYKGNISSIGKLISNKDI